jgi:hypothetical protein
MTVKPRWAPTLSRRIRDMAARYGFDADERQVCLNDGARDPARWHVMLDTDERTHRHRGRFDSATALIGQVIRTPAKVTQ